MKGPYKRILVLSDAIPAPSLAEHRDVQHERVKKEEGGESVALLGTHSDRRKFAITPTADRLLWR